MIMQQTNQMACVIAILAIMLTSCMVQAAPFEEELIEELAFRGLLARLLREQQPQPKQKN